MFPFILAFLAIYNPQHWRSYPSMDEVRCITTSPSRLYIAVPNGVYILRRSTYRHIRTLTRADGIAEPVRLCAYNPLRGDLFITTENHIYQFLATTAVLSELNPPFKHIYSIGIGPDGAYFDTETGIFHKHKIAQQFTKTRSIPVKITWYGRRDTAKPRDYIFLVPYYFTDEQLINHPMNLVFPDNRTRRLYVAAQDYGITVYNLSTGLPEHRICLGPSSESVRRITNLEGRLWFTAPNHTTTLDPDGNWSHFRTRFGDLPGTGFRLLFTNLLDLERRENINAVLGESSNAYLGTDKGLYLLGPKGKLTQILDIGLPVNGLTRIGDSLLLGTDAGLFALARESLFELQDPFDRTGFGVYSIARTATGLTYFGTFGGMLSLDSTGHWEQIIPPGFDLSKPVYGLTAAGNIVFYDNGSGITAYDAQNRTWNTIGRTDGLPSDTITALYADQRYLWITSAGLITRLDYKAELK